MVDNDDNTKLKLLCLSDYAHTGFGRVMREILGRLHATGLFEIQQVAWCFSGDPDVFEDAQAHGIRLHPGREGWGQKNVHKLLTSDWRPDVIYSLGDPWMIAWLGKMQREIADKHGLAPVPWVAYVPIDRPVLSLSWEDGLMMPDELVLYSKFGVRVVEEQLPGRDPKFIPHGVNSTVFRPLEPGAKMGIREVLTIPKHAFTVGMVGRNQVRKNLPATFGIFKAFNCQCCTDSQRQRDGADAYGYPLPPERAYDCPVCGAFLQDPAKEDSRLYLHCTMGESALDRTAGSWAVAELVLRYGLKDRVHGTPNISVTKGVSDEDLNRVYNAFHAMLLPTTREGFGLPVLEAASAGVPVVATDCSSVSELLEGGCGLPIEVAYWQCDPFFEADSAYVDIAHGAQQLHRLFSDRAFLIESAARARRFARQNDWDDFTDKWIELLFDAAGREAPGGEAAEPALSIAGGAE